MHNTILFYLLEEVGLHLEWCHELPKELQDEINKNVPSNVVDEGLKATKKWLLWC